jgi:hypothetical protein
VCLGVGRLSGKREEQPELEPERPTVARAEASDGGVPDGGAAELAEQALAARVEKAEVPRGWASLQKDMPKKPLPGQGRPNADGKCHRSWYVAIRGACWIEGKGSKPPCDDNWYEWKGLCYSPAPESQDEPASNPP